MFYKYSQLYQGPTSYYNVIINWSIDYVLHCAKGTIILAWIFSHLYNSLWYCIRFSRLHSYRAVSIFISLVYRKQWRDQVAGISSIVQISSVESVRFIISFTSISDSHCARKQLYVLTDRQNALIFIRTTFHVSNIQ